MSAMRNARSGALCREAIDNASHDLLSLPRTQFRQRRIERSLAADLRMRRGQKAPRLVLILPDVFGHGDYPCQALRALAFGGTQAFPPPLISCLRNNPVHHGGLFRGIREYVPCHAAKS